MKMTNEKSAKKTLSVIVVSVVGIIIVCLVNYDIIFGRWPKPASSLPFWIGMWLVEVGVILAGLGYWLKIGRKRVSDSKLTIRKTLLAVVLTILATLGYCGIMLFSLPFTGNIMTSWILGLTFAASVILLCTSSMLKCHGTTRE